MQFLQAESYSTNINGIGALISQFKLESVPELTKLKVYMGSVYKNLVEKWQIWLRKH